MTANTPRAARIKAGKMQAANRRAGALRDGAAGARAKANAWYKSGKGAAAGRSAGSPASASSSKS